MDNQLTIAGITYNLIQQVEESPHCSCDFCSGEYLDDYDYDDYDAEVDEPEVVENPFEVGNYVTVVTPKRVGHRVSESGKVIAITPSEFWDNAVIPEVYVEFATAASGCGNAQGRVDSRHGCRMPVTGLTLI